MGRVIMSGIVPLLSKPVKGTKVGTLAVGSSVYLMENGDRTEFLVVNQSVPSGSNLYDSSCDGTWLLRKDIKEKRQWNSTDNSNYEKSAINNWLNGEYLNSFDVIGRKVIKQVKIPYVNVTGGTSVASGADGLSVRVFLLGGYELHWSTTTNSNFPIDGAVLDYFKGTAASDAKREARLNGTLTNWWLRSPYTDYSMHTWLVKTNGGYNYDMTSTSQGIRPALILPSTAKIDDTGLLIG